MNRDLVLQLATESNVTQAGIFELERFAELLEKHVLQNAQVSIPTDAMEQEFAREYKKGFAAGKQQALKETCTPNIPGSLTIRLTKLTNDDRVLINQVVITDREDNVGVATAAVMKMWFQIEDAYHNKC